ncbi:hypothetical protein [Vibrio marisflavi]|uniref:Uncharacterized protein n=1 Tax=Vibrio marisflavi CECT 7928 TaxID=634439 RepID=A0ABN8DXK8_9VIBR|nr:hypothetical protein [Vibrio marisflavi]CAH0536331.1 hypothetical protein VMF7928_00343 [Vibrio marisflavi CECT 7928]
MFDSESWQVSILVICDQRLITDDQVNSKRRAIGFAFSFRNNTELHNFWSLIQFIGFDSD